MASDMLTHPSSLLNRQIHSHETLNTYFSKIEALLEVAMKSENFSGVTSHNYLWAVSDMVGQAKECNENSLNVLLKGA